MKNEKYSEMKLGKLLSISAECPIQALRFQYFFLAKRQKSIYLAFAGNNSQAFKITGGGKWNLTSES
jgi:hypothetical protein